MTDPSDLQSADDLGDIIGMVLEQADEIAPLDAARAEAWASDVLALTWEAGLEPDMVFAALARHGSQNAAIALAALSGVAGGVPEPTWPEAPPGWVAAIGTSRCRGAWVLRSGEAESLVFAFVDALDQRHVMSIDLVPGPPETIGEVMVGPGDLLDVLDEDDARLEREDAGPVPLAARCVAALSATTRPPLSAVVNGRLLLRRLATLTTVEVDPPVAVEDEIPTLPERDPDDDAYALEVLERALGPGRAEDHPAVAVIAALVAPESLAPLAAAERDAVLILEWADWLGAVIGLCRAGEGSAVDGSVMVDMVNRCPEVTTTIPKGDRARIEWAFDTVTKGWRELGLVDDAGLTADAVHVLPNALRRAWS